MIRVSRVHAPVALAVLGLAMVPTLYALLVAGRHDSCADPTAMAGVGSALAWQDLEDRRASSDSATIQWTHGADSELGVTRRFTVVRSFDAVRLYIRPPRFLLPNFETEIQTLDWLETGSERIPVHRLYDGSGGVPHLLSYVFVYGGEPVQRPLFAQLRSSLSQLLGGTRPLTLLMVATQGLDSDAAVAQANAWLDETWRYYRAACLGNGAGPVSDAATGRGAGS